MTPPTRVVVDLRVDAHEVDLVSGLLWSSGDVVAIEEVPDGEGAVVLRVGCAEGSDGAAVLAGLDDRWVAELREVPADAWIDGERARFDVVAAGEHVLIVPPGRTPADAPEDVQGRAVVISLDAAGAFGSGSHVTTVMALAMLERVVRAGAAVLDVGTGSGVLAIAAAFLGAHRVVAIDIDPAAVDAATANVRRNRLDDGTLADVLVGSTPLAEVEGSFDVIVANISAGALLDLAPAIVDRVRPDGTLVLTGILLRRMHEVVDAYAALGWTAMGSTEADGWGLLRLARDAPR